MDGNGYCDAYSRCVVTEYTGPLSNILLNDHHGGYFNFFLQVFYNHIKILSSFVNYYKKNFI